MKTGNRRSLTRRSQTRVFKLTWFATTIVVIVALAAYGGRFAAGRAAADEEPRSVPRSTASRAPGIRGGRVLLAFRYVVPGLTDERQLLANSKWGRLVGEHQEEDGTVLLTYEIGSWESVTAVLRDGVGQAVDAVPPKNASAEDLADVLNLGRLEPTETLPPGAGIGIEIEPAWKAFRCEAGPGIVFADVSEGERRVRLLRLYAPPGVAGPAQEK